MSSPFDPERRPVEDEWSAARHDSIQSDQPHGTQSPYGPPQPPGPQPPAPQQPGSQPQYGPPQYGQAQPYGNSAPYAFQQPYAPAAYPGPDGTFATSGTVTGPSSHRGRRVLVGVAAAVAIALVGGGVGAAAIGVSSHSTSASTADSSSGTPVQTVVNSSNSSIANVVKAADPLVVSIVAQGGNEEDLGSGIVLKSNGVILTNNHVVSTAANGGKVAVTFSTGQTVPATIVASDESKDLAIIKASGVSGLPTATLANSSNVQVGDSVVAIGDELGLANSVSSGIVSALHRKVTVPAEDGSSGGGSSGQSAGTTYGDAIQTDAAINQGDSGGALFNMQGQVIGIDSVIMTTSGGGAGSVGIGFAIAINDARDFIAANS